MYWARPAASVPIAWIWARGSPAIRTSFQAGGMARDRTRRRSASSRSALPSGPTQAYPRPLRRRSIVSASPVTWRRRVISRLLLNDVALRHELEGQEDQREGHDHSRERKQQHPEIHRPPAALPDFRRVLFSVVGPHRILPSGTAG